MANEIFRHLHRVTYSECAPGNHVYYARYLDVLEAARGEFFRHLGLTFRLLQEQDTLFPVVECHLRYKAAARYDDALTVELWPAAATKVRLNFAYRVLNQHGTVILEGETCHVCARLNEKPKRLPTELLERLRPFFPKANPAAERGGREREREAAA